MVQLLQGQSHICFAQNDGFEHLGRMLSRQLDAALPELFTQARQRFRNDGIGERGSTDCAQ
jgi:hypothetical protein